MNYNKFFSTMFTNKKHLIEKSASVSIIIIQYGDIEYLKKCLTSIFKNTSCTEISVEIVIVSNKSLITQGEIENIPTSFKGKIKVIYSNENLGYAGSINLGLKYSTGSVMVILNNDIEVTPGWLESLLECLAKDEKIAGCQGKILSLSNRDRFDIAGAAGAYLDKYGYTFFRGRIFDVLERDSGQYDDKIEVFWICGVSMAIKKEIFNRVGVFDEDFFMYGEEIDWCWRSRLSGYKFFFTPGTTIYHIGSAATGKWQPHKKIYYFHRNHLLLLLKNTSTIDLISILPVKIFLEFVAIGYYLFKKDIKGAYAVFKSLFWLTTNFVSIWKKHNKVQSNRTVPDSKIKRKLLQRSIVFLHFVLRKKYYSDLKIVR
jgi:GT2 family glycosyltransferase